MGRERVQIGKAIEEILELVDQVVDLAAGVEDGLLGDFARGVVHMQGKVLGLGAGFDEVADIRFHKAVEQGDEQVRGGTDAGGVAFRELFASPSKL